MIIIKAVDGKTYELDEKKWPRHLVEELRAGMMTDPGSNVAYMERVADFIKGIFGEDINTQNEKEFIEALIKWGVLQRIM